MFGAGLTLRALGWDREKVVPYLRSKRPDALTAPGPGGPMFAEYLEKRG